MATKISPTQKKVLQFLSDVGEIETRAGEVPITNVELGRDGITVEYPEQTASRTKEFKTGFSNLMKQFFNNVYDLADKSGTKYSGNHYIIFSATKKGGATKKRKRMDTRVQEEATTVVFNRVLDNNKRFTSEESILADPKTKEELTKTFKKHGGYVEMMEDWTWTFFQQQNEFFKKYEGNKWDVFKYEGDDFVTFFKKLIKEVKDGNKTTGLKPLGKYETWNPSDIWAAYDLGEVVKEINENLKKPKRLSELNALLIRLFKENKLVGISLKKVIVDQDAHLKLVNVDTKTMRLGDVDAYGMPQIKLQMVAIFEGETVTTYVKYGSDDAYKININVTDKKKGSNLTFNTQISATPAAQGGQSPTEQVQKLLKRKPGYKGTFINDWHKYPLMVQQTDKKGFWDESAKWEKMYTLVSKTYQGPSPTYEKWKQFISELYMNDKTFIAVAKLMQLHFYYDAIDNYGRDVEFWTDLLYLGMKMGKRFAPHAKIS